MTLFELQGLFYYQKFDCFRPSLAKELNLSTLKGMICGIKAAPNTSVVSQVVLYREWVVPLD